MHNNTVEILLKPQS